MLLQALFENLRFKDRVLTRKRVVRVDTIEGLVHVQTEEGSRYTGNIVVGADGVHSVVRKEMQRSSLESGPERLFQTDRDDSSSSRTQELPMNLLLMLLMQRSHPIQNASLVYPDGPNHCLPLLCRSTHSSTAGIT